MFVETKYGKRANGILDAYKNSVVIDEERIILLFCDKYIHRKKNNISIYMEQSLNAHRCWVMYTFRCHIKIIEIKKSNSLTIALSMPMLLAILNYEFFEIV